MAIPSTMFNYAVFYIFFLVIFVALIAYTDINTYIASDLSIEEPTFTAYTGTILDNVVWLGTNISFIFTLIITNPFSGFALLYELFLGMTIIFCIFVYFMVTSGIHG
jgi:hypothetical protein